MNQHPKKNELTDQDFDFADQLSESILDTVYTYSEKHNDNLNLLLYIAISLLSNCVISEKPFYRKKLAEKIVREVKQELLSPSIIFWNRKKDSLNDAE